MESQIKIKFLKINGFSVNEKLLKAEPRLLEVTKETVDKLCIQIGKYFKDNKIEVETSFEIS